ncbi:short chain dehydrogenase, partial [Bacillus thuringiensis]|nr:short chain dehydrogenase [Bacillus thuringiensis]
MIQHIRELTGYTKRVITVKRGMIQFIGLFDQQMKEFMEMLYLTEKPVVLSGEKYERYIGDIPKTSYYNGLKEMIISMQKKGV